MTPCSAFGQVQQRIDDWALLEVFKAEAAGLLPENGVLRLYWGAMGIPKLRLLPLLVP